MLKKEYIFIFHFQMMYDTPLLVNIKGCGYPPDIACPKFASRYNDTWFNNQVISSNNEKILNKKSNLEHFYSLKNDLM